MTRVAAVLLHLVIAVAIALLLLALWLGDAAEAARRLFLFMDIGLGVWLLLLIVSAVRGWGPRAVMVSAVAGVVANLLTVLVVGFVQQGGVAGEFLFFGLTAGIAFLVGAGVAATVVWLLVRPRP